VLHRKGRRSGTRIYDAQTDPGKLKKLPLEHKVLPLLPEYAGLSSEDELYMIREGYLKRDGDKFYLPEIIRHALGFKYEKGARPKVLALTLKS